MAVDKESPDSIQKDKHGTIPRSYWMKVLEERYERLHAKVINGTTRFSTGKNSNYATKCPPARHWRGTKQVSNRQDVNSLAMTNGNKLKQNHKSEKVNSEEYNQAECSIISSSEFNGKPTSNQCLKSLCTTKLENSVSENYCQTSTTCTSMLPDVQLSKNGGLKNLGNSSDEPPAVPNQDLVDDCLSVNSCSQSSLNVSQTVNDHLSNHHEIGKYKEHSYKIDKGVNTEEDTDNSGELKHTEIKYLENKRNRRRRSIRKGINAWVFNATQKTTTDLPENRFHRESSHKSKHVRNSNNNKGRRAIEHNTIYGAVQQLNSRGTNEHRSRLFARMSIEAQRAVDETLKEMKGDGADTISQVENTNINSSPLYKQSNHARVVNDNNQPTHSTNNINGQARNPSTEQDSVEKASAGSMFLRNKVTQGVPSNNYNSFQFSTSSSNQKKTGMQNHFVTNQKQTTVKVTRALDKSQYHLPLLENKTAATTQILTSNHVNLPGIRNHRDALSFRETTFEITPLNFDIRFHQIYPRHREDRETPSPDTQQQAIEKCHQWLVKYMSIN